MRFLVLHAPGLRDEAEAAASAIADAWPGVRPLRPQERNPPESTFDTWRGQRFGPDLLNRLGRPAPGLWLVSDDLYTTGMNFVFGLARAGAGAVVSNHRLPDADMVRKEAVHEVGHVLGLGHCTRACVMQYSNSLEEAQAKPARPCDACAREAAAALQA